MASDDEELERSALEAQLSALLAVHLREPRGWLPRLRALAGAAPSSAARQVPAPSKNWSEFLARAAACPAEAAPFAATMALHDGPREPRAADLLFALLAAEPRRVFAALETWRRDAVASTSPIQDRDDAERLVSQLGAGAAPPRVARVLAVHTLLPSGYVREAALARLCGVLDADVLPFVLLRLADGVPPVRAAAARAVEAWLSPLNARALLRSRPHLARASRRARFEHNELATRYDALLRSQARTGLFVERLDDPEREIRRMAYEFALQTEGAGVLGELVLRALATHDAHIVALAVTALERVEDAAERAALSREAARARARALNE